MGGAQMSVPTSLSPGPCLPTQECLFLSPLPSQPFWMEIKKDRKKRSSHNLAGVPTRRRFLLSVVSVEFPLPTCHDLPAARPVSPRPVFPTPGLVGVGVEKTPSRWGWELGA